MQNCKKQIQVDILEYKAGTLIGADIQPDTQRQETWEKEGNFAVPRAIWLQVFKPPTSSQALKRT